MKKLKFIAYSCLPHIKSQIDNTKNSKWKMKSKYYRKLTSFTHGNSSSIFHEDWISWKLSISFSLLAPSNGAEHLVTLSSVSPQYLQSVDSGVTDFSTGFLKGFLRTCSDEDDGESDDADSSEESSDKSSVKSITRSRNGRIFFLGRRGAPLKTE